MDNLQSSVDQASGYGVHAHPKSEKLAVDNLNRQCFETYRPRYKAFKKTPSGYICPMEVMFLRCVFFKPYDKRLFISVARSTRGVSSVLSFGAKPTLLKDAELQVLQQFEKQQNQRDLADISPFQPASKVRLLDKSLNGFKGLVQSVFSTRVWVFLELLGRQNLVSIDHCQPQLA